MKPNMGGVKSFINIDVDEEGNEIEEIIEEIEEVSNNYEDDDVATTSNASNDVDATSNASNDADKLIQQQMELHSRIVENISENQKKSAENMENKHNHKRNRKTVEFEIGDAVAQK